MDPDIELKFKSKGIGAINAKLNNCEAIINEK